VQDLADYRAVQRTPVCVVYRIHEVCGMPPPSSGGIAVAQTLLILENFDLAALAPRNIDRHGGQPTAAGVHLVAEANRLAYADRNRYVADTDFVRLPGGSWHTMLGKAYLRDRAGLIRPGQTLGIAAPGNLGPVGGTDLALGLPDTTHLSIVDRSGNVVSMTTTIEGGFGSFHMTRGFLLNNELTDFSPVPFDASGPIANRVEPLKRPRSSMAPTLVFRRNPDGTRGEFHLATGSPGGAAIIQYVTKTLVVALDWGLDVQQAVSLPNFGSANGPATNVEGGHPGVTQGLLDDLAARGHTLSRAPQTSGLSSIARTLRDGVAGLAGGSDPRRENVAIGDRAPAR
jgi:gamma-glutamyltranspeptidase / glutathione hydrolase